MKKYQIALSVLSILLVVGIFAGCDNRSQLEKDMDAAAKKASDALR